MFQRQIYLLSVLLIILIYGCANPEKKMEVSSQSDSETPALKKEWKFSQYIVRVFYNDDDGGSFGIYKNNKRVVYEKEVVGVGGLGCRVVSPGRDTEHQTDDPVEIKDITGDGIPDLILEVFSGGAHCCFTYYIYSLGDSLKRIAKIETGDSQFEFQDVDGDSIYEMKGYDVTFAYWQTSFAESPMPNIILRYTPEGYRLALDLMTKPAPAEADISKQVQFVQSQFGDRGNKTMQDKPWADTAAPPSLWSYMLDLIYSGNSRVAWQFYDRAWPKDQKGKPEFWAAFVKKLQQSPYWKEIEPTFQKP